MKLLTELLVVVPALVFLVVYKLKLSKHFDEREDLYDKDHK